MSAEEAWSLVYGNMAEFVLVPFAQFKVRLADHRRQVTRHKTRSREEEMALEHDRQLFPRQNRNHRNELVFDLHPAKLDPGAPKMSGIVSQISTSMISDRGLCVFSTASRDKK